MFFLTKGHFGGFPYSLFCLNTLKIIPKFKQNHVNFGKLRLHQGFSDRNCLCRLAHSSGLSLAKRPSARPLAPSLARAPARAPARPPVHPTARSPARPPVRPSDRPSVRPTDRPLTQSPSSPPARPSVFQFFIFLEIVKSSSDALAGFPGAD